MRSLWATGGCRACRSVPRINVCVCACVCGEGGSHASDQERQAHAAHLETGPSQSAGHHAGCCVKAVVSKRVTQGHTCAIAAPPARRHCRRQAPPARHRGRPVGLPCRPGRGLRRAHGGATGRASVRGASAVSHRCPSLAGHVAALYVLAGWRAWCWLAPRLDRLEQWSGL